MEHRNPGNNKASQSDFKAPLEFGNDMSRIVRGVAILFMVVGHSLPGKVVAFAVPLFSFLVGYGYNFSRERNLRHALRRAWHLLGRFWFILFAICIPATLIAGVKAVEPGKLALNMFGLNGTYNFYCWYIYFYLIAMALMPGISRLIDKWGWKAVALMSLACAAGFWYFDSLIAELPKLALRSGKGTALNVCARTLRYLPVVMAGYWLAKYKVFSKFRYRRTRLSALLAAAGLVAVYFLRDLPYSKVADLAWAPLACALVAIVFGSMQLKWLRGTLTRLGIASMGIWFLHALFFTHATRKVFMPLVAWLPIGWCRIIAVLLLSWLMAETVEFVYVRLERGVAKLFSLVRVRLAR